MMEKWIGDKKISDRKTLIPRREIVRATRSTFLSCFRAWIHLMLWKWLYTPRKSLYKIFCDFDHHGNDSLDRSTGSFLSTWSVHRTAAQVPSTRSFHQVLAYKPTNKHDHWLTLMIDGIGHWWPLSITWHKKSLRPVLAPHFFPPLVLIKKSFKRCIS